MRLYVNVKPKIRVAYTKDDLMLRVSGGYYQFSRYFGTYGDGFMSRDRKLIRVYNLQKINKKVERTTITKNGKTKSQSKVLHHKYWVANIYDFDIELLKALNIKVKQQKRNFVIEKRNDY